MTRLCYSTGCITLIVCTQLLNPETEEYRRYIAQKQQLAATAAAAAAAAEAATNAAAAAMRSTVKLKGNAAKAAAAAAAAAATAGQREPLLQITDGTAGSAATPVNSSSALTVYNSANGNSTAATANTTKGSVSASSNVTGVTVPGSAPAKRGTKKGGSTAVVVQLVPADQETAEHRRARLEQRRQKARKGS
jgi:hypothetical protein